MAKIKSLKIDFSHTFPSSKNAEPFQLRYKFEARANFTAFFGNSGSGKSSLLNAVAGLFTPNQGSIYFEDRCFFDTNKKINLKIHKRKIGYVFQEARLFPHMRVEDNLQYGAKNLASPRSKTEFNAIIELLGLTNLLKRYPQDLSGGEKQRVAIGRALLSKPQLLLMDEPLAALDLPRKLEILPYLLSLKDYSDIPIFFVSHQPHEIAWVADEVIHIENGRNTHQLPINDFMHKIGHIDQQFLRDVTSGIKAKYQGVSEDGLYTFLTAGGILYTPKQYYPQTHIKHHSEIIIHIYARDITLFTEYPLNSSALNILSAKIIAITPSTHGQIHVECALYDETNDIEESDTLIVAITERSQKNLALEIGMPCYLSIKSISMS